MRWRATVAAVVVLVFVFLFLHHRRSTSSTIGRVSSTTVDVPLALPLAGPAYAYPNRDLTPGATDPTVTEDNIDLTICVPGYTKKVRPPERITNALKHQIMASYGLSGDVRDYELDHLVPLELGGCPDCVSNLWPEPYDSTLGARQKDRVENFLHRQVCSGAISLKEAQGAIQNDWVRVYVQINPEP